MSSDGQIDFVAGAILGCAVGDAIGLPNEGISKRRASRLLGEPDRHRFVSGCGMISDDTEHTCMVAQALCSAPRDVEAFVRDFGRRLRWWLVGCPAGIGLATLRATIKLWLGFSAARSGVYSAGNGPAMRSAVLGAAIDDSEHLRAFVKASTRITHTDPKAYHGALAVAQAAWCAKRGLDTPLAFFDKCRLLVGIDFSDEFNSLMAKLEKSLVVGEPTEDFAQQLGCVEGVTGYVYHTVPVALHCWLSYPRDYRSAVQLVIRCGGDADTTAAIVGAIIGSGLGLEGIPQEWLQGFCEWPHSVSWMQRLAQATAQAVSTGERLPLARDFFIFSVARNALFLAIVVGHVLRRLLPPY